MTLSCFKAYDVRGRLGDELSGDLVRRVGRAYGEFLKPGRVAVGGDARQSSEELKAVLAQGLAEAGADVLDLGLTGTEEIYHAVFSQNLDGGIEVTGSHNPLSDNGLKFVRAGSRPVSGDTGLREIERLTETGAFGAAGRRGRIEPACFKDQYVEHLLGYVDPRSLPPLKIVADAGNGAAGPVLQRLQKALAEAGAGMEFVNICLEPDGSFPNGLPNPLLPEKRDRAARAVRDHRADLGLAWDGDFDRCFFFDEKGEFIEGYYLVGLLAEAFLGLHPGAAIIHDPRLVWNTLDIVNQKGGRAIQSKTGHAFIKERMREEKAVYGGEMSAHHYFADFAYCDSGMIPWLLVLELMGQKNALLSSLVAERQALFPTSGELNYRVADAPAVLAGLEARYAPGAVKVEHVDGLSLENDDWRFNVRSSNTEPLLRLNLETRGDLAAVAARVREIEGFIKRF